MGEAADDIIEGITCQYCGVYFDDFLNGEEPPGHPRSCEACEDEIMGKVSHTPTPWACTEPDGADLDLEITGADGFVVAILDPRESPIDFENAAFIVRACNAHEELVGWMENMKAISCEEILGKKCWDSLCSILAKAKGSI